MKNFKFKLAFKFAFSEGIQHFLYFLKLILFAWLTFFALRAALYISTVESISYITKKPLPAEIFQEKLKSSRKQSKDISKIFKFNYLHKNIRDLYVYFYLYTKNKGISGFILIILFFVILTLFLILIELFDYNAIDAGLNISEDNPIEKAYFSKLFKRNFWRFVIARFWYYIKVILGLILLIIPGIYIAIKYYFTGFDIIDNNASITEDIRTTKKITKNIKLKLLLFMMLTSLISAFLFIFFMIIYLLSKTSIYKQLKQDT